MKRVILLGLSILLLAGCGGPAKENKKAEPKASSTTTSTVIKEETTTSSTSVKTESDTTDRIGYPIKSDGKNQIDANTYEEKRSPVFSVTYSLTDGKISKVTLNADKMPFDPSLDESIIAEHVADYTDKTAKRFNMLDANDYLYKSDDGKSWSVKYDTDDNGQVLKVYIEEAK